MKIKTDYWIKPIPLRGCDWTAWDDDTYDGAPDSATRNQIGYGRTRQEAIDDLMATLVELSDDPHERNADGVGGETLNPSDDAEMGTSEWRARHNIDDDDDDDYESGAEQAQRMQDAKEGFNDD